MGKGYDELGVSASKAGLHEVLKRTGTASDDGLFCSILPDIAGDPNYTFVSHSDGAGTKTIIPYLYFRETGSRELFAGLAQDALVMNLDDVFCIGAPEQMVLANTIGRNAALIDDEVLAELIGGYKNLCDNLRKIGIDITLAGGETADCGDTVRTLVVDAVLSARLKTNRLIRASAIAPGCSIVGFSSTGRTNYEESENAGIGSNGLTLARHCLLSNKYADAEYEACAPQLPESAVYRGPYTVTDTPAELSMSVGEALASPTRTYAPVLRKVYEDFGEAVQGVIHNTGGGQTKALRFGSANRIVKDQLFPTPPLFSLIQEHGEVDWREMYQVFNMGHRLELYVAPEAAEDIIKIAAEFSLEAQVIGRVETAPSPKNELIVESPHGSFSYPE